MKNLSKMSGSDIHKFCHALFKKMHLSDWSESRVYLSLNCSTDYNLCGSFQVWVGAECIYSTVSVNETNLPDHVTLAQQRLMEHVWLLEAYSRFYQAA